MGSRDAAWGDGDLIGCLETDAMRFFFGLENTEIENDEQHQVPNMPLLLFSEIVVGNGCWEIVSESEMLKLKSKDAVWSMGTKET